VSMVKSFTASYAGLCLASGIYGSWIDSNKPVLKSFISAWSGSSHAPYGLPCSAAKLPKHRTKSMSTHDCRHSSDTSGKSTFWNSASVPRKSWYRASGCHQCMVMSDFVMFAAF
jgi:hypothetical protein